MQKEYPSFNGRKICTNGERLAEQIDSSTVPNSRRYYSSQLAKRRIKDEIGSKNELLCCLQWIETRWPRVIDFVTNCLESSVQMGEMFLPLHDDIGSRRVD